MPTYEELMQQENELTQQREQLVEGLANTPIRETYKTPEELRQLQDLTRGGNTAALAKRLFHTPHYKGEEI